MSYSECKLCRNGADICCDRCCREAAPTIAALVAALVACKLSQDMLWRENWAHFAPATESALRQAIDGTTAALKLAKGE